MNKRIYKKLPVIKPCMTYGVHQRLTTRYVDLNKNFLQYPLVNTYVILSTGWSQTQHYI